MALHLTLRAAWHCLLAAAVTLLLVCGADPAGAASSKGCEGGGFAVTALADGSTVSPMVPGGDLTTTIPTARLGLSFVVKGKYVEFTVVPNALDITGGSRTMVFASKTPDHRGLALTSAVNVEITGPDLVIERTGPGLGMTLQAKDCANGGIFQMEPERGDGTTTRITHTLADGIFYFDNPNFRAREGDVVPFKATTIAVANRINFASGNNVAAKFVGRDSPQVGTRVDEPGCTNEFPNRAEIGGTDTVQQCGGRSIWDVASGGRMGQIMGEDATEVAPPPTLCTQNCQAQNRVRGQAVVLGFPFPVPDSSRLTPRFATP